VANQPLPRTHYYHYWADIGALPSLVPLTAALAAQQLRTGHLVQCKIYYEDDGRNTSATGLLPSNAAMRPPARLQRISDHSLVSSAVLPTLRKHISHLLLPFFPHLSLPSIPFPFTSPIDSTAHLLIPQCISSSLAPQALSAPPSSNKCSSLHPSQKSQSSLVDQLPKLRDTPKRAS
jgi:hypothetical protein